MANGSIALNLQDMADREAPSSAISSHLSLWETVSIIVGIVVGVSIFKVPSIVFSNVSNAWIGLGAWLLGGTLSVVGALCYAELATGYPRMGGDYQYLNRAYHPYVGYLFGWGRLSIMQTGSIGALAYVFADYTKALFPATSPAWCAAGVVVVLTTINILGVQSGKTAQNILTSAKVLGLLGVVTAGLFFSSAQAFSSTRSVSGPGFGLAMILILYAYGGWNEAAFVSSEMRDPRKNIPRALLLSTGAITLIYLVVNSAFLLAMGFDGLRSSSVSAADVLGPVLGTWGIRGMSVLVLLSVLGALNGTILTGSRVYTAMGSDHHLFSTLNRWSPRLKTPVFSFAVQGAISLIMILAVGTPTGQDTINRVLTSIGALALPWDKYGGGFDTLVAGAAPVFWFFFLLSGASVLVLRFRDSATARPFRVPLFPLLPLLFCATCLYMMYSSITYAGGLSLIGLLLLAAGAPLFFVGRSRHGG